MTSATSAEMTRPRSALLPANFSPLKSGRRTAIASYLLALLLGLYAAHYLLPTRAIFAEDIRVRPVFQYDAAMNVYGQRYFTKEPWRWPPFLVKKLGAPQGTNVGFMDGIPLAELIVKLFRRFLPPDFHSVYLWLALCWVLQPVAAVFALRSAGERRLVPNLAIALIAVSMPTLFLRFVHAALCSHFLILLALGLYFRITKQPRLATLVAAGALMLAALLVNPYIMEMVIAVLVAAPISLLVRRDRAWMAVTVGIGAGIIVTALSALLIGYGHAVPMGGFGTFSMNLLSPIYPTLAFWGDFIDATGGQYEGYHYLGVGVILLLLLGDFSLNMQERIAMLRRHAGLVFSCIVLTLLALSTKVYAGHRLLLDLPTPSWLLELRSSGRLFWPVAYVCVIAGVLIVSRKLPARWAFVVVLVCASLQYAETMPMRREVRRVIKTRPGYTIDTTLFRSLLATHSQLMVWPKFGCGADVRVPEFSQLYLLASEVDIPVNMTYVGRFSKSPDCTIPADPITVGNKELLVFVPTWNAGMVSSVADWRDICRKSGVLVVCAQDLRGRTDLPVPDFTMLPLGQTLSTAIDGPGNQWLISGWYPAEAWGTWSDGSKADLAAAFDKSAPKGLVLRVWANALAVPQGNTQPVTVVVEGRPIATWDVKSSPAEYTATIPPLPGDAKGLTVEFHIGHPVIPSQVGLNADPRELGFGLRAFRFDELK